MLHSLLCHSFLALFADCAYVQGSVGEMVEGEDRRPPQSSKLTEVMCVLIQNRDQGCGGVVECLLVM